MPRILALLLIIASAFATSPALAEPSDIAAAGRGVVRVVLVAETGDEVMMVGHGSGLAVSKNRVLTNAHVVRAARDMDYIRIGVVPPQGKTGWFARIIAFAPDIDLALLELTESGTMQPLTIFTGDALDGEDVFAVGYPGNVDQAQGLSFGDIVSPISPVKTRGSVSTGRSVREYDTILHTAAIGSGNSGGPLLDECGRVIGVNSFGTIAGAADSEFYFAVSAKEILRFLRKAGASPRTSGTTCRSLADIERAEVQRSASERDASEEQARRSAETSRLEKERATQLALFEIMTERDNRLALSVLLLVLAIGAGGGAYAMYQRDRPRDLRIAGGMAGALIAIAILVWFTRPGFADLEDRAAQIADGTAGDDQAMPDDRPDNGKYSCVIDNERSRLTVSNATDIAIDWRSDGCAGGTTQFASGQDGWTRIAIPQGEDTASLASFDPGSGTYRVENYFLEMGDAAKMRTELGKIKSPGCSAGENSSREFGRSQQTARAMLPATPNERLVYECSPSK